MTAPLPNLRPLRAGAFVRATAPTHRVYRSAGLAWYGPRGIEAIVRGLGVGVFVDLRTEPERARDPAEIQRAQAAFHRVVHIPIASPGGRPANPMPGAEDYVEFYVKLLASNHGLATAFLAVVEHIDAGVLFACSQGKDRTGLLTAALLLAAGRPRDEVLADYAASLHAIAQHGLVGPHCWQDLGLTREAYMQRYELGAAPLRRLLLHLDAEGQSLLGLVRARAADAHAFDAAVARLGAPSEVG